MRSFHERGGHRDPPVHCFPIKGRLPNRRQILNERILTRTQKGLLIWSVFALAGAEAIKHVSLSETASTAVGAVELILAIATGIAFGLSVSKSKA